MIANIKTRHKNSVRMLVVVAALLLSVMCYGMIPVYPLSSVDSDVPKTNYIYLDNATGELHYLTDVPNEMQVSGIGKTIVNHFNEKNSYIIRCVGQSECGIKLTTYASSHDYNKYLPGLSVHNNTVNLDKRQIILSNYSYLFTRFKSLPGVNSDFLSMPGIINKAYINRNIIYVATNNGLAVSYDNGQHWHNFTTTNGLSSNQVNGIYRHENRLYLGTYSGGLIYSSDLTHWQKATMKNTDNIFGLTGFKGYHSNIMFAATDKALMRSDDGGQTWKAICLKATCLDYAVSFVKIGGDNKSVIVKLNSGELYASLNYGKKFYQVTDLAYVTTGNPVSNAYITQRHGRQPILIYTVYDEGLFSGELLQEKNNDDTLAFQLTSDIWRAYISDFSVINNTLIFSPDQNPTWKGLEIAELGGAGEVHLCPESILSDVGHFSVLSRAGKDSIDAFSDTILYNLNFADNGNVCQPTITTLSKSIGSSNPVGIRQVVSTSTVLYANSNGVLYTSNNNGRDWQKINTPGAVSSVAIYKNYIFIGTYDNVSGVYVSSNKGKKWKSTGLSGVAYTIVPLKTKSQLLLYVGMSHNLGLRKGYLERHQWKWTSIMSVGYFPAITLGADSKVYAIDLNYGVGIVNSDDSYILVGQALPGKSGMMAITSYGNNIYVGMDGVIKGIYRLHLLPDQKHVTIKKISGTDTTGVFSLVAYHGDLYAGTDGYGVWKTKISNNRNDNTQWKKFTTADGLGSNIIYTMDFYGNTGYFGTMNNGLFTRTL